MLGDEEGCVAIDGLCRLILLTNHRKMPGHAYHVVWCHEKMT